MSWPIPMLHAPPFYSLPVGTRGNTNVDMDGKPSDADLQRLTCSQYYVGNVAKSGLIL